MSLPKVTPSFLFAIIVTLNGPVKENLCVIVNDVVVVSGVLSPKFQVKYDALYEHEALNDTLVLVVIVLGEYVKHASVGLEQEVAKLQKKVKIVKR